MRCHLSLFLLRPCRKNTWETPFVFLVFLFIPLVSSFFGVLCVFYSFCAIYCSFYTLVIIPIFSLNITMSYCCISTKHKCFFLVFSCYYHIIPLFSFCLHYCKKKLVAKNPFFRDYIYILSETSAC